VAGIAAIYPQPLLPAAHNVSTYAPASSNATHGGGSGGSGGGTAAPCMTGAYELCVPWAFVAVGLGCGACVLLPTMQCDRQSYFLSVSQCPLLHTAGDGAFEVREGMQWLQPRRHEASAG
jgi:hypothetical protein